MDERPMFQHPSWMVGIMLILGAVSLLVGLTLDPFWLVMGSPAILTLLVFVGVRVVLLRRSIATPPGLDPQQPDESPNDADATDGEGQR